MFHKGTGPPSSMLNRKPRKKQQDLIGLLFNSEDGGNMFLYNVRHTDF
jgi:hypothetical protein